MKTFRYGCFGPWRPYRYAYGYAVSTPEPADADTAGSRAGCYEQRRHGHRRSGSFGVRRPLRYLSYQLDLDETQRRRIAVVLDALKTEREQAALDEKKMISNLADLVADPEVSDERLTEALSARVRSTERVQGHIARALKEIVAALDPDQREEFAYLLRTGTFRI